MEFYRSLSRRFFDVIIASPPCTDYSAAMTCRAMSLKIADQIVQRTIDIINYFQPRHWFIENPKPGFSKGDPLWKIMHMWMLIFVNSAPGVPKTNSHLGSGIPEKSNIQNLRPKNLHQLHSSPLGTFGTSPSTETHTLRRCAPCISEGPIPNSRGID